MINGEFTGHDLFWGTVPEFELRVLRKQKKGGEECSENFRMKVTNNRSHAYNGLK
jgi:hypothetical protein